MLPPLICIIFLKKKSFDCILIRFQNTTPVSLQLKLFLCYLSQYSKVQHYFYQLAFRSHFCVLFHNPATMSNVFLIPTSKFSVSNIPRGSCQANLQWVLLFVQGTSVGGFFCYYRSFPILFPSIINVLNNGSLLCVWYASKKNLGVLSNYICSGQRGFTKIKREFVLHLLHTCLKKTCHWSRMLQAEIYHFLENNVAKNWKAVKRIPDKLSYRAVAHGSRQLLKKTDY